MLQGGWTEMRLCRAWAIISRWTTTHAVIFIVSHLGSVLCWLKSTCHLVPLVLNDNELSSIHTSYCGVLQGFVFGPLLFIMYTTSLSTLFSSISLDHHLCADDTQHFFSFLLLNFDSSIFYFENAVQHISSRMTYMFLANVNVLRYVC